HIVILDDTPSMGETGQAGTGVTTTTPFAEAGKQITDRIMPAGAQALTPPRLRILRLSHPPGPPNPGPTEEPPHINSKLMEQVRATLAEAKPSAVRTSVVAGLKNAKELLDKVPNDNARVVHLISDMRSTDWTDDAEAISQAIRDLTDGSGAAVHMIDV